MQEEVKQNVQGQIQSMFDVVNEWFGEDHFIDFLLTNKQLERRLSPMISITVSKLLLILTFEAIRLRQNSIRVDSVFELRNLNLPPAIIKHDLRKLVIRHFIWIEETSEGDFLHLLEPHQLLKIFWVHALME